MAIDFKNIEFIGAYGTSSQIPASKLPEVSFVGRSNVGKSSFLNRLINRKQLARVSQQPGKTSTVNFFGNEGLHLVDLPGYGYAKVAKSEKSRWAEMIEGYFDQYRFYALVVSLIDIRHPATKLDEQMVTFLRECEMPFIIALTKADKLSNQQCLKQRNAIRKQLGLPGDFPMVITSSAKGTGFDEIRTIIKDACK